jgi:hypothetical protein
MLQLMIKHLEGFEPIQRKILLYCFSTETALIMKPMCAKVEEKNQQIPESSIHIHMFTIWQLLMPPKNIYSNIYKNPKKMEHMNTQGYVVYRELLVARIPLDLICEPIISREPLRLLAQIQEIWFEQRYMLLTRAEENGTPTGIIMRQYIKSLTRRGLMLRQNESLWKRTSIYLTTATFLFGEIRDKWGCSMDMQLPDAVHHDLTKAIEEYIDMQWKIPVW